MKDFINNFKQNDSKKSQVARDLNKQYSGKIGASGFRGDLEESLRSIDDDKTKPIISKKELKRNSKRHPKLRKRLIIWAIILIILGAAGYMVFKIFFVSKKLFNGGSIISLIENGTPLKTDGEGRTNILLMGTSQDDSAHTNAVGGGGLWLTDSIELISIDQKQNTVKMIGIPRDLWVSLGDDCSIGQYGKINSVYECGSGLSSSNGQTDSTYSKKDKAGASQLVQTVANVTGMSTQYYVHVDYGVLKKVVDDIGGIDVDIEGDGADGIYDTNFDWECAKRSYTCKNVYYPKNGTYHLSGTQALYLARARGDSGAYSYKDFGLNKGDFDRQANQQKIMIAIESKIKNASVFANPVTLSNLLDDLGNNITTDLSGGEIKTLLTFAKKISSKNMSQVSLVSSGSAVVTTSEIDGQSVVVPTSGANDYSSIINYLAKQLSSNPAVSENATISIYNASSVAGKAASEKTTLESKGYNISGIGNAENSDADSSVAYTLYDLSNGSKPKTLSQLESDLSVKATSSSLPGDISATSNFVIVINK